MGTKLKIAFATGIHSTVGADILNHCVNDILTQGAEPLFFLDYLAMGKLDAQVVEQVIEGMSRAAKKAGCSLIGGETAEMPDFYPPGEYDLAGFIVGAVEKKKQLDPRRVRPGDALLALPSSGLHTNGYSLARKLVFGVAKLEPDTYVAEVGNKIGAELLKPHRAYWPLLKNILERGWVTSMAHITGGGITGNLPRALPRNVQAVVELGSWPVLPIFRYLAQLGRIERDELLQTFNLGVGMILVVPAKNISRVEAELKRRREKFYLIGRIESAARGKPRVAYSGTLARLGLRLGRSSSTTGALRCDGVLPACGTVLIFSDMKKRIAVLLSGRGSNFEALADSVAAGRIPERGDRARAQQSRGRAGNREGARARARDVRDSVEGTRARGVRQAGGCGAQREERRSRLPRGIHAAAFAVFRGGVSRTHPEYSSVAAAGVSGTGIAAAGARTRRRNLPAAPCISWTKIWTRGRLFCRRWCRSRMATRKRRFPNAFCARSTGFIRRRCASCWKGAIASRAAAC